MLKSTRNLQGYKPGGEQAHGAPKASEARPIEAGEMKDGKPDPKHYQDVMPAVKSDSKQELHWKVKLEKGEATGLLGIFSRRHRLQEIALEASHSWTQKLLGLKIFLVWISTSNKVLPTSFLILRGVCSVLCGRRESFLRSR